MSETPRHCGGLPGRCPTCIEIYRAAIGSRVPYCEVCDHHHWAYENHHLLENQNLLR